MFVYYSKHFDATSIVSRVVPVVCDKCGCEYFYQLARIGTGSGTAAYGIGSGAAANSANTKARQEAEQRVQDEAELVPCPECHWINDDLVAGYRRSQYRGLKTLAMVLGIGGTILSLVVGGICYSEPQAEPSTYLPSLIGGPILSIAVAGLVMSLRRFVRGLIRPNQNHPLHPPRLPRGTPPALVRNPGSGQLELFVSKRDSTEDGADDWMDFQLGRSGFPQVCCGCLESSSLPFTYRYTIRPALALVLPLCAACRRRWRKQSWLGGLIAFGVAIAVGFVVFGLLNVNEIAIVLTIAGLAVLLITGLIVTSRRAVPVRVKMVDRSRGVARIWFRNERVREAILGKRATAEV